MIVREIMGIAIRDIGIVDRIFRSQEIYGGQNCQAGQLCRLSTLSPCPAQLSSRRARVQC